MSSIKGGYVDYETGVEIPNGPVMRRSGRPRTLIGPRLPQTASEMMHGRLGRFYSVRPKSRSRKSRKSSSRSRSRSRSPRRKRRSTKRRSTKRKSPRKSRSRSLRGGLEGGEVPSAPVDMKVDLAGGKIEGGKLEGGAVESASPVISGGAEVSAPTAPEVPVSGGSDVVPATAAEALAGGEEAKADPAIEGGGKKKSGKRSSMRRSHRRSHSRSRSRKHHHSPVTGRKLTPSRSYRRALKLRRDLEELTLGGNSGMKRIEEIAEAKVDAQKLKNASSTPLAETIRNQVIAIEPNSPTRADKRDRALINDNKLIRKTRRSS